MTFFYVKKKAAIIRYKMHCHRGRLCSLVKIRAIFFSGNLRAIYLSKNKQYVQMQNLEFPINFDFLLCDLRIQNVPIFFKTECMEHKVFLYIIMTSNYGTFPMNPRVLSPFDKLSKQSVDWNEVLNENG